MTNDQRENNSDQATQLLVWYIYILRLEDDSFYIGQTNDLSIRLAEHATGGGANATAGQEGKLVWFNQTHDREAAKKMEARLQKALNRSPLEIQKIVDRFDQLLRTVRPEKTLADLQRDEREYESEMRLSYHHVQVSRGIRKSTCGWWAGLDGTVHGTGDWSHLAQMIREKDALESVGGTYGGFVGRKPCKRCLALMPND